MNRLEQFLKAEYPHLNELQRQNVKELVARRQTGDLLKVKKNICDQFQEWLNTN